MSKVFRSLYGPGLGLIVDGKKGLLQGFANAATAYFGGPRAVGLSVLRAAASSFAKGAPPMDAGKVNVRISDPERWLNAGRFRQGGGALFGEFDAKGRFWFIVVHSDEILHAPYSYFLDDLPATIGADHYVIQKEFRLKTNKNKDPAESDGQGKGYVRIWTTTYSETNPTPPGIAELTAALPQWTAQHLLVGTTYSVICMDALDIEHRSKIYRWSGVFRLGEPGVSVLGEWANVYDPRDPSQTLGNRATYKPSRNAALVWAWFRTHPFGRGKAESEISWDRIAEQATFCDETVSGIEGDQPRYEANVAIVDSARRADAEKQIMAACDGQIVFDETGKSWLRVGHWYEPTLAFSRMRDIMSMESLEGQDGETPTHGIIVKYIEPSANYTVQPSAAWINPLYYDPLTTPKFQTVEIQACQNHNQAMRLAKGLGLRLQPRHMISPAVNLRGLQARHERIVSINYDAVFTGSYEIATPVELDSVGTFTDFSAVPISPSRWTLLAGEEQPKPVSDGGTVAPIYRAITGENVYYSDGTIRIDFPALQRDDAVYLAEYIPTSAITGDDADPWTPMAINDVSAVSGNVPAGVSYTVRYRYVTSAGRGPGWEYGAIEPVAVLPSSTNLTATGAPGQATVTWKNPTDARFFASNVYRGSSTSFPAATKIIDAYGGGLGQVQSIVDTVAAGTWNYWIVATDGALLEASPTGPIAATVT